MDSMRKKAEHLEWQSLFIAVITDLPETEREEELRKLVITLLNGVQGKVMEPHYSLFYQLPFPTIHSGHSLVVPFSTHYMVDKGLKVSLVLLLIFKRIISLISPSH
jgi:hypothetical protein